MAGGRAAVFTAALRGVEALPVTVEVSTSGGIPGLDIVGLPDSSVLEAKQRVRCAITGSGYTMPRAHVTINLSPSEMKKNGTGFDLPIAVAVLIATGQLPEAIARRCLFVGALGLDGSVEPVRGDVAYAMLARSEALCLVTSAQSQLPSELESEIRFMWSLSQLKGGVDALMTAQGAHAPLSSESSSPALDFVDVFDQEIPKRAMVIAAAGGHGMLMVGPPGAGKTMLARRLPTILPALSPIERAEAMLIHSVAGMPIEGIARGERPFRSPHHSISVGGLVGGGHPVYPGEISLADKGVLFLDELPEFARNALQSLRQPMEDHVVRIVRVDGSYTFPCDFQLVAAANPCPCGHLGDPGHECTCSQARIASYQARIGGPLMDRIDVVVDVARPRSQRVIEGHLGMSSHEMSEMVIQAREFAAWRQSQGKGEAGAGVAALGFELSAASALEGIAERMALGGRAIVRVGRVARTIADLAGHDKIATDDLMEAVGFRSRSQE